MKQSRLFKAMTLALFAVVLFSAASCTKTDDRDQFVGNYRINVTGSYTMTVNGESYTYPLQSSDNATLTITKSTVSQNTVFVDGFYSAEAEVVGNTIMIDSETGTQTSNDGVTVTMTFSHNRGTLSGNTLSFTSNITGNAYYQGYSFPIHGSASNIAYKQ